ncbi:MAG: DNA-processing protein DprA [bacterium]|jgi:DNA processing protein
MTGEERAWLKIAAVRGVGDKKLWMLADLVWREGGSLSWLMEHPDHLESSLKIKLNPDDGVYSESGADNAFDYLERNGIEVLHPLHGDFPPRLVIRKDFPGVSPLLYALGNRKIFERTSVSVVGSRRASQSAVAIAQNLARELAENCINVTSGYANGVDLAAHAGALMARGTTTAVLADGISRFRMNPTLGEFSTEDNMLVVSQFNPSAVWTPYNAMKRNKLVCALSDAVVVIRSGAERDADGRMSGTFDAGMSALKMGIPLFVVAPENLEDDCAGNRALIDKGGISWNPTDGAGMIAVEAEKCHSSLTAGIGARESDNSESRQMTLFK